MIYNGQNVSKFGFFLQKFGFFYKKRHLKLFEPTEIMDPAATRQCLTCETLYMQFVNANSSYARHINDGLRQSENRTQSGYK